MRIQITDNQKLNRQLSELRRRKPKNRNSKLLPTNQQPKKKKRK